MTRFQVRRKLRKACSKAKYVALGTVGMGQGNATNMAFSTFVKRSTMKAGAFSLIGVASVVGVSPSQAAVVNGDFETGDFTAWETIGDTSVSNGQAFLSSNGIDKTNLQTFLGLNPESLDALNNINVTIGSAIKQTVTVNTGDILTFDWVFKAEDYLPFDDFSFYTIGSSIYKLADVSTVGDYGQKESTTSFSVQSPGTYTIGFGVVNALDFGLSSNLKIDNVKVKPVPEPLTILGSLAAGSFGVALRRKYNKQEQKETAKV